MSCDSWCFSDTLTLEQNISACDITTMVLVLWCVTFLQKYNQTSVFTGKRNKTVKSNELTNPLDTELCDNIHVVIYYPLTTTSIEKTFISEEMFSMVH